jgi:intracellular multiplication protein IcmE
MMTVEEERDKRCRALGIPGGAQGLYSMIVESRGDPKRLLSHKLNAETLLGLGYSQEGMQQIGYNEEALEVLGYIQKKQSEIKTQSPSSEKSLSELTETCDANQLKSMGFMLHHLRQEGIDARIAARIGFGLDELSREYSAYDLKVAGFSIAELRNYFDGSQLRTAGFAARDMRREGFSIRDMQTFGYNDNQIRTAGYTQSELMEAGMMRLTIDKKGAQRL